MFLLAPPSLLAPATGPLFIRLYKRESLTRGQCALAAHIHDAGGRRLYSRLLAQEYAGQLYNFGMYVVWITKVWST